MRVHDLIPGIVEDDESDFRPIKEGKEVDAVSEEQRVIQPGERYYDGGTVSKVAGKDGVSAKSAMSAAEYAPEPSGDKSTMWVVVDGEMKEVPKNKVYLGGTRG